MYYIISLSLAAAGIYLIATAFLAIIKYNDCD